MSKTVRNPWEMSDEEIMSMTSPEELITSDSDSNTDNENEDQNQNTDNNKELFDETTSSTSTNQEGNNNYSDNEGSTGNQKQITEEEDEEKKNQKKEEDYFSGSTTKTSTEDQKQQNQEEQTQQQKVEGNNEANSAKQGKDSSAGSKINTAKDIDTKKDSDNIQDDKKQENQQVDYKAFYERVMAPFRANGKTIELKSPEEVLQLMQMGANYTKKMQSIAPYRKTLLMLENNNLLNEDKLSFLIDLDKKNPEAIKKLLKDSNIDPLDIDTSIEPAYKAGTNKVSDAEANFMSVLSELKTQETGMATIRTINDTWDEQSKDLLWNDPSIMNTIHQQMNNGAYQLIVDEMERRKMLGQLSPSVPFLMAYQQVGNDLVRQKQRQAQSMQSVQNQSVQPQQPVAVKKQSTKPSVTNDKQARAAGITKTNSKPAKKFINPLAMSDEEFLKQWNNRV